MANENSKKKRRKKLRQEWNPHWSLKTLYTLGSTALSVVKIAIGAALTVGHLGGLSAERYLEGSFGLVY